MTLPEKWAILYHIEELREKARLSQVDVAELIGVTRRAYIAWGEEEGAEVSDDRLPALKYAKFIMEQGLRTGRLPIIGHDRRPGTAKKRRDVIKELKQCYPINPFSL